MSNISQISTLGNEVEVFPVELSTRFLQHFSEQLYSSPQKAFEELISNGWDAGASQVAVFIPEDLQSTDAALCVFDNGESMNDAGLKQLWRIADSPKATMTENYGRPIVGKFGIGKLATYVLAERLTHICKGGDGKIRRVTMDYGSLTAQSPGEQDKLVSEMNVRIFEMTTDQVLSLLNQLPYGQNLKDILDAPPPAIIDAADDEFRPFPDAFVPPASGTWTLVILSKLRTAGRSIKSGILRRMVSASLPMGAKMGIWLNGQQIQSSKLDGEKLQTWTIGPDLDVKTISVPSLDTETENGDKEIILSTEYEPVPHINLPGIGPVTGCVTLFTERLTGGKSEEHGASNGFHVNVLGRIINQSDPAFGEANLSHAAWARFRMTVRADGLNDHLITNRESFKKNEQLRVFRAFLRAVFNKVRVAYDAKLEEENKDAADVLLRALGPVSLQPLRSAVSEALQNQEYLPSLIDCADISDRSQALTVWRKSTGDDLRKSLEKVEWGSRASESPLAVFRVLDQSLVINKQHPFVLEHRSGAEKQLIREVSLINFLTDLYAMDIGVDQHHAVELMAFRDRLLRIKSYESRRSAPLIAQMLMDYQHDGNYRKLEKALTAALRCLGFEVEELAASGEPEGVAVALAIPRQGIDGQARLYSFTYDAKSTTKEKAQTNNLNHARLADHRRHHKADYTLVVAPDFQGGNTVQLNESNGVTPLRARDLARLLQITATLGAIPFTKFREIFSMFDPGVVSEWITQLEADIAESRKLTLSEFLAALKKLSRSKTVQSIPPALLQHELEAAGINAKHEEVLALSRGLTVLLPDLISLDGENIRLSMSPEKIAETVELQLQQMRASIQ